MTHTYTITGMTCNGCAAKIQKLLSQVDGIDGVRINLEKNEAEVDMRTHVETEVLKAALKDHPKYVLAEAAAPAHTHLGPAAASSTPGSSSHALRPAAHPVNGAMAVRPTDKTIGPAEPVPAISLRVYKPLLLVFGYILLVTLLTSAGDWMRGMHVFMGGFFLTFSFFKLLDLKGFAESYAMYDIVAQRWTGWGYVYTMIELLLGVAYVTGFEPLLTNALTFVVMTVSIVGVIQSRLKKQAIRCACLGAVFNLPMSTVTIIEDGLMIAMSGISWWLLR